MVVVVFDFCGLSKKKQYMLVQLYFNCRELKYK